MGVYLSNLVKIGNILLSERDKFSFHFGLNLQLNLLTVPLCQSLMSSNKLNRSSLQVNWFLFYLSAAYLGCNYILGLCFRYLWIHCFSYYVLLSRFYSLWWHRHLNHRFRAQFQKSSWYDYHFCIGEPILVCYQQSFHGLFQFLSHYCHNLLLSFYYLVTEVYQQDKSQKARRVRAPSSRLWMQPVSPPGNLESVNCRNDWWFHIVNLLRKVSHNKFICLLDISQLFVYLIIESPMTTVMQTDRSFQNLKNPVNIVTWHFCWL